jgi:2-isopropylmalate synthase
MQYQIADAAEEVLNAVKESVTFARNFTDDVEWSAMDATRTEDDFLCRCVEPPSKAARRPSISPTPSATRCRMNMAPNSKCCSTACRTSTRRSFPFTATTIWALAVANSLAGVKAGARQIECTINGIGERAGNAALEEIVMALRTARICCPSRNNIDTTKITKISRTLSTITGFNVQPNKAIVGANAFAHESGIHQDGVLKHAGTYEIMTPESVGLTKSNLVMGKHSGRHAFRKKLEELGFELGDNALNDAFARFKVLADKKKTVYEEDLIALIEDEVVSEHEDIKFVSLQVQAGSKGPQTAELCLSIDGEEKCANVEGNGPVDAIFKAIRAIIPHPDARLKLYQVHAITGGTDAQAEVTVRLEENGKTVNGQGTDADTLVASARAYIHALNKLMVKRGKLNPQAIAATP